MRSIHTPCMAIVISAAIAGTAVAQSNLEEPGNIQMTGVTEISYIEQGGAKAAAIGKTLERIEMPPGFKIALYAIVPNARHMAVGPQDIVTFVGTTKSDVWLVTDRDKDRVADEVKRFAPSLDLKIPNGVCITKDGFLYIVEKNRVLLFPAATSSFESPDVVAVPIVPQGGLIPVEEESYSHSARVCAIGPDDKLYISLGQPYNVSPPEKLDLYKRVGIGGIIRMNRDGSNREVYAYGVRNSVGHDFNPANGELWFTDNQVDGMGDDIPPGELNRITEMGQNFGFPWFGGGTTRTHEYAGETPPDGIVHPVVDMVAHAADLGMMFYTGKMFPEKYRGGIFSAQHGSWDRTTPIGARVMFTAVNEDGSAGESGPFAEGWIDENERYLGRPVAIAQLRDGSILVSDDLAGAVYRISYGN